MQAKAKILIVDPQQQRAQETRQQILAWGWEARICTGHLQALAWLEDEGHDLALVELEDSDIGGLEFCRLLRRREGQLADGSRTWILLLGPEEQRAWLCSSDSGADDFLLRPFLDTELRWRLGSGLQKQALQSSLRSALRLTPERTVLNRYGLFYALSQELNRSSRQDKRFSVLLIILQGLNLAELSFGSAWAAWLEDRFLQILHSRLRSYDKLGTVARWQWCLIVPDSSFADLRALRQRLAPELQEVLQQEAREAGGIQVYCHGLNLLPSLEYWAVEQGAHSLWAWIQDCVEQPGAEPDLGSAQLTREGILLQG
ncbi:MAG: hypothetical protein ACOC43_13255 [Desulfohalobiaceae bacterium]